MYGDTKTASRQDANFVYAGRTQEAKTQNAGDPRVDLLLSYFLAVLYPYPPVSPSLI